MFALNVSVITQPCYFLWGLSELIGVILSHHRGTPTIITQVTNNYMSKEGDLIHVTLENKTFLKLKFLI